MSRSSHHLGLAVVLWGVAGVLGMASGVRAEVVLCRTWTSYVRAREDSCGWGETEIPLPKESPKTFFVTSATFPNGDLLDAAKADPYNCSVNDGLDAADCICQRLADASDFVPGGKYKAWLSVYGDLARSPSKRFTHPDVPYIRPDGVLIANNYEDLVDGSLLASPSVDENKTAVATTAPVWTGTLADGTPYETVSLDYDNCNGWRASSPTEGRSGAAGAMNALWTDAVSDTCTLPSRRLYCVEQ